MNNNETKYYDQLTVYFPATFLKGKCHFLKLRMKIKYKIF